MVWFFAVLSGARGEATPLMRAAAALDYVDIQAQLNAGADVNERDDQGRTALYYALTARSAPAMNWLIAKGADPDAADREGKTLLEAAFETGDVTLFKPLLWARAPRKWSPVTLRVLDAALEKKREPFVRTLLAAHDGPPVPVGARQPLLAWLLARGQSDAFRLMLECGADPDLPLVAPVEKAFLQAVRNAELRGILERERGVTLLMLGAGDERLEAVEALIDHNARTDLCTAHGKWTALNVAHACKASPEMYQLLLGKKPEAENRKIRVEISIKQQQAVVFKNDVEVLTVPVSTGKPGHETPTGRFVVTDKDTMRMSSIYTFACMPFFMRLSCSEYGIHAGEVPKNQPASHGCIRVPLELAQGLFDEVEVGTQVTISP